MASSSFIVGIIGNVISMLVFLAPVKTFKYIVQKKSTENFKGIPYITTLLSTSLWAFYGLLMPGGLLVVTMNGTGVALHIIYVSLFLTYAPKNVRIQSLKMVGIIDVAFFGAVVAITLLALHGNTRLMPVGLLCTGLTIGMYASHFYEMV
nr:bidirectional sugar transporter SWEET16-like isoform X2 [Ipomoea trifida]